MSRLIRPFCALFLALTSVASLCAQQVYIATGSGGVAGTLYQFNVATGTQISSVPITNANGGGAIGVAGLAFNPLNGVLYGVSVSKTDPTGNTVGSALLSINPTTGKATVLGSLVLGASFSQVGDISFASDGTLYGWESRNPFSLSTIAISGGTPGRMTTIGSSGYPTTTGGGLALSPTDSNTFYVSATGADPDFGTLDTVNRTTGAVTAGPAITNAPKSGAMTALAFFGNTLYGANTSQDPNELNDQNQPDEVHMVTINLVNGAVTDLFRIPFNDVDAIAFAPVPEPSTVGLMIMGATGAAALRFYRRRR